MDHAPPFLRKEKKKSKISRKEEKKGGARGPKENKKVTATIKSAIQRFKNGPCDVAQRGPKHRR